MATETKVAKPVVEKPAVEKAPAAVKKPVADKKPAPKAKSQRDVVAALAEATGLEKKQIVGVFDALYTFITAELTKGPGVALVPNLVKIKLTHKPATVERKAISPLTKQEITIKAKPARSSVKSVPIKSLKDAVA